MFLPLADYEKILKLVALVGLHLYDCHKSDRCKAAKKKCKMDSFFE